jgi:hypothetical protein
MHDHPPSYPQHGNRGAWAHLVLLELGVHRPPILGRAGRQARPGPKEVVGHAGLPPEALRVDDQLLCGRQGRISHSWPGISVDRTVPALHASSYPLLARRSPAPLLALTPVSAAAAQESPAALQEPIDPARMAKHPPPPLPSHKVQGQTLCAGPARQHMEHDLGVPRTYAAMLPLLPDSECLRTGRLSPGGPGPPLWSWWTP